LRYENYFSMLFASTDLAEYCMSATRAIHAIAMMLRVLPVALLLMATKPCAADSSQEPIPEYQLKAAYIYKILPFVHWSEDGDPHGALTIGVFGKEAHLAARRLLTGRTISSKDKNTRRIEVVELTTQAITEIGAIDAFKFLARCDVVFVSVTCRAQSRKILEWARGRSVLTFGETDEFLESGGIINFVTEQKKIRFEVNLVAARSAQLTMGAQLLRVAKRVIKDR